MVVLSALLFSCSRESSEPSWEPQSHLGSKTYKGGLFPVWITLKEPISDANSIEWKSERAREAYRSQAIDANKLILADTVFLYWDEPPKPDIKIDSSKGTNDTTFYYRDTVFAVVNGLKSLPIVIEVENILARIKKITVGGLDQFGDSVLTIAANPNAKMEISILLEKPFNNKIGGYPTIEMPKEMEKQLSLDESKSSGDTLKVYNWKVPSDTMDMTLSLKIKDSRAYGERLYKLHMIVYTEQGSVWVAAEKELVKFSSMGTEVARIDGFESIGDIAVYSYSNSNYGKLFVADRGGNSIHIYDPYGKLLDKDNTSFQSPMGIAVGVESAGGYVWVADAIDDAVQPPEIQLRSFRFSSGAKLGSQVANYPMFGYIEGLSVDQFKSDFVWFAVPERDTVGFTVENETTPKYVVSNDLTWDRPSMVNYDPKNKIAWIADNGASNGRVVAVDTSKKVKAIITGFGHVSSISACGNDIWVSDIQRREVYRFKGPFRGDPLDLQYTVAKGEKYEGFSRPVSVSALVDCSVWVVDNGNNKVVLLDGLGKPETPPKASGTGLKSPILGKAVLIVE